MKKVIFFQTLFLLVFFIGFSSAISCDAGDTSGTCTISTAQVFSNGETFSANNLVLQSGGSISNINNQYKLILDLSGNLTLENTSYIQGGNVSIYASNINVSEGARIYSDYLGYPLRQGPGYHGQYYGGNYGGRSAYNPKSLYGDPYSPTSLGSGGHNGAGGGAIFINTTEIIIDGTLSSLGQSATSKNYAGGSGGSIWIITNNLSGGGTISANGGNSHALGAGGGRISLVNVSNYNFEGLVSVNGGSSSWGYPGRAGTITFPQSKLDNFVLNQTLRLGADINYTFGNLTILENGILELDGDELINYNSVTGLYEGSSAKIFADKINITASGKISADYLGFPMRRGPGYQSCYCGATHAGRGGGIQEIFMEMLFPQ